VLLLPVADVLSEYRALCKAIFIALFSFWDLCRVMLRFLFFFVCFSGCMGSRELTITRGATFSCLGMVSYSLFFGYEYLIVEIDVRWNHSNHAEIKVSSDWANWFCQHWDWDWQLDETITNVFEGWITILLFTSCMWINLNVFLSLGWGH